MAVVVNDSSFTSKMEELIAVISGLTNGSGATAQLSVLDNGKTVVITMDNNSFTLNPIPKATFLNKMNQLAVACDNAFKL